MPTNGNGRMFRVVMWLAGILVSAVVLVTLPALANNMIKNDNASRDRDQYLEDCSKAIVKDFNHELKEQRTIITQTATDVKWIKRELEK